MSYSDRTLTCADCGVDFVFTAGEQEFHASKGFTNDPSRCPDCRARRKQRRSEGEGGGGYGGGYGGGGHDRGQREMYEVPCASCGRTARVPFQPSGGRPVYCRDCFDRSGGGRR